MKGKKKKKTMLKKVSLLKEILSSLHYANKATMFIKTSSLLGQFKTLSLEKDDINVVNVL